MNPNMPSADYLESQTIYLHNWYIPGSTMDIYINIISRCHIKYLMVFLPSAMWSCRSNDYRKRVVVELRLSSSIIIGCHQQNQAAHGTSTVQQQSGWCGLQMIYYFLLSNYDIHSVGMCITRHLYSYILYH